MEAIRVFLRRRRTQARFALVLAVLGLMPPVEHVWCSEGGETPPRLEFAVNGSCVSLALAGECCDSRDDLHLAPEAAGDNAEIYTAHDHCLACTDNPALTPRLATAQSPVKPLVHFPAGGCLFDATRLLQPGCIAEFDAGAGSSERRSTPLLSLLITYSTILQI